MRPTDTHIASRARQIIAALCFSISLSAGEFSADSIMLDAYRREEMNTWRDYIDSARFEISDLRFQILLYEYGYCGYIVAEAKKEGKEALMPEAKARVQHFKSHVTRLASQLPVGHYEMYMSAVYVYELRLHESIHPMKSMSLAKEATKLAPQDPLVLSYYGTCLFYAPKPFGSKEEALKWFEKAEKYFEGDEWQYCWVREANQMYIGQCKEKLKNL